MTEIDPQDQVTSFNRNGPHPTKTTSGNTVADGSTTVYEGAQDLVSNGHAVHPSKDKEVTSITMRQTRGTQQNQTLNQSAPNESDEGQPDDGAARSRPQLLLRRNHTQQSTTQKARSPTDALFGATFSPSGAATDPKHPPENLDSDSGTKEKKKGVSFLSRFIGNKKKGASDEENEDESEQSLSRPEGMDAQLFSHTVDNIGFKPRHPQPPPYIKVRSKYKKEKEFDRVFLAQELQGRKQPIKRRTALNSPALEGNHSDTEEGAIWALEFSKDGRYLACGGQDKTVRVWAVISTLEDRRRHEKEEDEEDEEGQMAKRLRLDAPVFQNLPVREYEGHEGAVIDLSWSKNNFLLSASADKTVRLWHISRAECLCTFKHTEHVLSVQFHPRDDRFFLAGSRDMKLRLWSIPDKSVAFWKQLEGIITAVAFTPDGKTAIAGTVNGVCLFYETEGLKYQTQIHVRSAHGKNARGSKICGIQAITMPPDRELGDIKLLISSNDSRIRLYNLRDKSLEVKFKGHKSEERAIHATFSDDAQYIICGSEDKGAYIWSTAAIETEKSNQRPLEYFEATSSKTMWALLAPTKTRQLLSQSEDPIYDLCNPPPVTLVSRSESAASSRPPTENGSIKATPATADSPSRKARESPAYISRSAHPDGQIIVAASSTGVLRVYRQDCAFSKRKSSDDASSIFGKKPSSVYMARAMSRSSTGVRTGRSDSTSTQPPQDRILSWRQGISSTQSVDRAAMRQGSDAKSTRSTSPGKSGRSIRRSESNARANGESPMPMPRIVSTTASPDEESSKKRAGSPQSLDEANPLWLQGGRSFMAWNPKEVASQVLKEKDDTHLSASDRPELAETRSKASIVSTLSSEEVSEDGTETEVESAAEIRCKRCGSTSFKAKMVRGEGHRLVCQRCGLPA